MNQVAIIAHDVQVPQDEIAIVAAAVNVQIARDLARSWSVQASVTAYTDDGAVQGQNPFFVMLVADANGSDGVHKLENGTTLALVKYQPNLDWSVAASHEILEMLVDPTLNYTISAPSLRDGSIQARYLVEICDPVQRNSYQIDSAHEAWVSDFVLPSYYQSGGPTGPYTCQGALSEPFTLYPNGYLTWIEPSAGGDLYYQYSAVSGPAQLFGPVDANTVFGDTMGAKRARSAVDRCEAFPGRPLHFLPKQKSKRKSIAQPKGTSIRSFVNGLLKT